MSDRKIENTVVTERNTMRCRMCGDELPVPLGDSEWFLGVMRLFIRCHRGCREGSVGQRTYFQAAWTPLADEPDLPAAGGRVLPRQNCR
jgi:hypothetical protein